MSDRILHQLNFTRKLLLTAAAFLAIAAPITFGLLHATPSRAQDLTANATDPTFSSVSVRPSAIPDGDKRTQMMFSLKDGSFVARGVTLQRLIQTNYHLQDSQISGGPDWLNTAKFDVDAKLDPSQAAAVQQQLTEQKGADQALLQRLLASQFKLATHYESRTVPAFDLVAGEGGPKLQPTGDAPRTMRFGPGELSSSGAPLELLAAQLSARLGAPVVDKTGLKGNYAFNLHWSPDATEEEHLKESGEPVAPERLKDANGTALTTALLEQLGLKLEPHTQRVQMLVIDHAEEPSQN